MRTAEKAAVVGATGAAIGMGATAAGVIPDLLWPSPAGELLSNSNSTATFFGVVNAVSSIAADIVEENVLPQLLGKDNLVSVATSEFTGPALAAGAGYAYLQFMSPQTLKNPFVSLPAILGMLATGEYVGKRVHDMIVARMMDSKADASKAPV